MSKNPFEFEIPENMVACGGVLRMYPSDEQLQPFFQSFGNNRYVWNQFNDMLNTRYKNNHDSKIPNKNDRYAILKQLKNEHEFLKLTDSTSLQVTVDNLTQAMFDFITRKTKNQGKPRFKGKNYYKQAFTCKSNAVKDKQEKVIHYTIRIVDETHVSLPKIGLVKTSNTASFKNYHILRATIVWRQDLNRFSISFTGLKPRPKHFKKTGKAVGVDLGLSNEWLVTSDGDRWTAPDTKELEREQAHWQSVTDKRLNGVNKHVREYNKIHGKHTTNKYSSKSWQRSRKTKSKYSIKMHNIRMDQVHKAVLYLVKNYDIIVIEDLKVSNMMKNHKLAKAIQNASWYLFREVLEYACNWYGKTLVVINPSYTSRTCSYCHKRNPQFTGMKTNEWLAVRAWICPFCKHEHDRDINAAVNILNRGLEQLKNSKLEIAKAKA